MSSRKYSSIPQRRSYQLTMRSAHCAVRPPSLDSSSHSNASSPAGGSGSSTRTSHTGTGATAPARPFGGSNSTRPIRISVTAVRFCRARCPPCDSISTLRL